MAEGAILFVYTLIIEQKQATWTSALAYLSSSIQNVQQPWFTINNSLTLICIL